MFITWGSGGTVAAPAWAAGGGGCWGAEATTVAAAAAGTASRVAADWLLKASAATATSQLAELCNPPRRSLGALRPRSAA